MQCCSTELTVRKIGRLSAFQVSTNPFFAADDVSAAFFGKKEYL